MKLSSIFFLLAAGGGFVSADLLSIANITESSAADCQDISASLTNFADQLTSSSCTLIDEASAEEPGERRQLGNIGPVPWTRLERLYNIYYGTCLAICGCLPYENGGGGRKLDTSAASAKVLKPVGDCDASLDALEAIDLDSIETSSCIGTSGSFLVNRFCVDPYGDAFESICAGYFYWDWCWNRLLIEDHERLLKEIDNYSAEEVVQEIEKYKANPKGVYVKKIDGLSAHACENAVSFLDGKKPEEFIHAGGPQPNNIVLSGEELVDIIGKDSARNLLDLFHKSVGFKAPITGIKLQRQVNEEVGVFTGHVDHKNTMIVFLKQNFDNEEIDGGGLYHYLGNKLEKTEKVTPGLTILHGHDVLHKSYPWTGVRDVLDIAHDPKKKDAKCMLMDILK